MSETIAISNSKNFPINFGENSDTIGRTTHSKNSDASRTRLTRTIDLSQLSPVLTRRTYSLLRTLRFQNIRAIPSEVGDAVNNTLQLRVEGPGPGPLAAVQEPYKGGKAARQVAMLRNLMHRSYVYEIPFLSHGM